MPASDVSIDATKDRPKGKQAVGDGKRAATKPTRSAQPRNEATQDEKFSIRKGIIPEVAPNPDHVLAESWRQMIDVELFDATCSTEASSRAPEAAMRRRSAGAWPR